jgi:hypothetical protein
MELSMEKTKITDVREGFDFLGRTGWPGRSWDRKSPHAQL